MRMVKYYDYKTNKLYTFITNNFKLAAKTIADIYKDRWQVELFFKWIKQNLKIKNFWGTSENAVMSQIWVAMIFYLLVSYIKFQTKSNLSILEFTRIIRATLFKKVALINLLSLRFNDIWKIRDNIASNQLKLAF
jgi:IS4 transposase